MSEKQQSPIQKAIARLTEVRDKAEKLGFKDRADAYNWTVQYLVEELLEEEKAFAFEAYKAGIEIPDFNKYYTKYTTP